MPGGENCLRINSDALLSRQKAAHRGDSAVDNRTRRCSRRVVYYCDELKGFTTAECSILSDYDRDSLVSCTLWGPKRASLHYSVGPGGFQRGLGTERRHPGPARKHLILQIALPQPPTSILLCSSLDVRVRYGTLRSKDELAISTQACSLD